MPPWLIVVIRADKKNILKLRSMNKQSKEFSWKWNPDIHQRQPFRRGEHAVQTDCSCQTCITVFKHTLPCNWIEKPWERAFMGITSCNWGGTPGFVGRNMQGAQANIFGYESLIVFGPICSWTSVWFSLKIVYCRWWDTVQLNQHICSMGQNYSSKWLSLRLMENEDERSSRWCCTLYNQSDSDSEIGWLMSISANRSLAIANVPHVFGTSLFTKEGPLLLSTSVSHIELYATKKTHIYACSVQRQQKTINMLVGREWLKMLELKN